MSSTYRSIMLVCAILFALTMLTGTVHATGPSGKSSCMGQEAAAISPPGSSDEIPGGMPGLKSIINTILPGPLGATIRQIASLHEGSHEACDEVLG